MVSLESGERTAFILRTISLRGAEVCLEASNESSESRPTRKEKYLEQETNDPNRSIHSRGCGRPRNDRPCSSEKPSWESRSPQTCGASRTCTGDRPSDGASCSRQWQNLSLCRTERWRPSCHL